VSPRGGQAPSFDPRRGGAGVEERIGKELVGGVVIGGAAPRWGGAPIAVVPTLNKA